MTEVEKELRIILIELEEIVKRIEAIIFSEECKSSENK